MRKVSSSERLIKLMDLFIQETSEEKMLSLDDIIYRLQEAFSMVNSIEFTIDRRTIRSDIEKLKSNRFYIEEYVAKRGKKLYYYKGEVFENYEIRILLDAVYSAKFITNKERENLIQKIKSLTNETNSIIYDSKLHIDQITVSENKELKYYLDKIHNSIYKNNKLVFQYGNYDTNKRFNLHHDGKYYKVWPYNLVWHNDFYYLVAFDEKKNSIVNYRVDRMRSVKVCDEKYELNPTFNIIKYLNRCFNMYPGEVSIIEIKFANKLINAIIDRFGTSVLIVDKNEENFTVRFNAAINEGLKRWILNWGVDAEVIYPEALKETIKEEILKMSIAYNL